MTDNCTGQTYILFSCQILATFLWNTDALPERNMRILQHKTSLAGYAPREMDHVLPGGLQEYLAWEPALSWEVLLWISGTTSSLWKAAQANYSVGFIWLPGDLSCDGGWWGCMSEAQDFLLGEKTSWAVLWLKPIPEPGHKCAQWSRVRPSPGFLTPVTVSALNTEGFLQWLHFVNQRLFQKVH